MERFFKLKENGTTVSTEIVAGITTFFTMAYIIVINPSLLSQSGMGSRVPCDHHSRHNWYPCYGAFRKCALRSGSRNGA